MTFDYEPMLVRQGFGRPHTLTPAVSEEPQDPHFFSLMGRPSNRLELMRRQLDWFRRYLDGPG